MNKEALLFFIKSTLENSKHLGDNLKKQCVDYVESLQQENQQLKKQQEKFRKYLVNKFPKIDFPSGGIDMGQYIKTSDGRRVYVPPRPDSAISDMPKEVEEFLREILFKYNKIMKKSDKVHNYTELQWDAIEIIGDKQ